jgi:hypothetical protein
MNGDGLVIHADRVPELGVADVVATLSAGMDRLGQLASAGRLTRGSLLKGAMVSTDIPHLAPQFAPIVAEQAVSGDREPFSSPSDLGTHLGNGGAKVCHGSG